MAAVTDSLFYVGQKFSCFNDLEKCKKEYEMSNFCNLTMRDAKTLQSMTKYAPKKAARAKKELRYYSLRLCCTYGGKKFKKRGEGKRETESRKVDCGMCIRVILSDDGESLDVVEFSPNHSNHIISSEVYFHLPQQRRLHESDLEHAETLMSVRANSKLVQQHLQNETGKVILLKDIANIGYKLRQHSMPNNIKEVIKQLNEHVDCVVEVLVTEDNIFRGLFYQDNYMQRVFQSYPEMLFCDATYKLLDLRLAVHILLAVDGNGQSEIVAVMLLADETKSTMTAAIKAFQNHNPAWTNTISVMTDKDFVERKVFNDLFPNALLLICLYHTLRTFRREVTCEKMGITSSQREQCLRILQDLAYSVDEDAYRSNMERLVILGCEKVTKYVKDYWEPIRHEWVEGLKAQHLTLGESTNNRLESINAKIKSVCSKHACLQRFFVDFRSFLSSMRIERRHRALMVFTKRQTAVVATEMVPYLEFLTPYAFRIVMVQYRKSLNVQFTAQTEATFTFNSHGSTISTTAGSCGCRTYCSKRLPCQHLLYVRRCLGLAFDESVLDSRWSRLSYMTHCNALQNEGTNATASISHVDDSAPMTRTSKLSQAAKYRKARNLTDSIASLCSEPGMTLFKQRCEVLQQLYDSWSKGEEVKLVDNLGALVVEGEPRNREIFEELVVEDVQVSEALVADVNLNEEEPVAVSTSVHNVMTVSEIAGGLVVEGEPRNREIFEELVVEDVQVGEALVAMAAPMSVVKPGSVETETQLSGVSMMDTLAAIQMPPAMRKRGRPKGSETTVIGLAKKKQKKGSNSSTSQTRASMDESCAECGLPEPPKGFSAKAKITWFQCDNCKKWVHGCCCNKNTLPKRRKDPFKCQLC